MEYNEMLKKINMFLIDNPTALENPDRLYAAVKDLSCNNSRVCRYHKRLMESKIIESITIGKVKYIYAEEVLYDRLFNEFEYKKELVERVVNYFNVICDCDVYRNYIDRNIDFYRATLSLDINKKLIDGIEDINGRDDKLYYQIVQWGKFKGRKLRWNIIEIKENYLDLVLVADIGKYQYEKDLGESQDVYFGYKQERKLKKSNWHNCFLRKFLVTEFYNLAFDDVEKSIINFVDIPNCEMTKQNKDLHGDEDCFINDGSHDRTRKSLILKKAYFKDNKGFNRCTFEKVNNNTYHKVKPIIRIGINELVYNELIEREKDLKQLRIKYRLKVLTKINNAMQYTNRLRYFGKFGHELQWILLGKITNNKGLVFILDRDLEIRKRIDCDIKKKCWSKTELNKWLNNYFYDKAFDVYEKSIIVPNAYGENVTLLSIDLYNAFSDKDKNIHRLITLSDTSMYYFLNSPMNYWLKSSNEQGFYYINEQYGLEIGHCTDEHSIRPVICIRTDFNKSNKL